jgi:hypothetical protein
MGSTTDDPTFRPLGPPLDLEKHHRELRAREAEQDRNAADLRYQQASGSGAIGRDKNKLTPEQRDKRFAKLLGWVMGGWLLWIGYTRGFGGDRIWDFVGPAVTVFAVPLVLTQFKVILRPLRWLATIALWVSLAGLAIYLLQAFKAA